MNGTGGGTGTGEVLPPRGSTSSCLIGGGKRFGPALNVDRIRRDPDCRLNGTEA